MSTSTEQGFQVHATMPGSFILGIKFRSHACMAHTLPTVPLSQLWYILPFYGWIPFRFMHLPHFVCPFLSWLTFWLFLLWGYYKPRCYEYSCSNFVWIYIWSFLGYTSKGRIIASRRNTRLESILACRCSVNYFHHYINSGIISLTPGPSPLTLTFLIFVSFNGETTEYKRPLPLVSDSSPRYYYSLSPMFYQNISYEGHQWRFHCQMIGYFLSSSSAHLSFVQAFPWLCLGAWICVLPPLFCLPYLLSFPQPMKTAAPSQVLLSDRACSPGIINQAIASNPLPRTSKFAPSPITFRFMDQITIPRLHLPIYGTFFKIATSKTIVWVFLLNSPSPTILPISVNVIFILLAAQAKDLGVTLGSSHTSYPSHRKSSWTCFLSVSTTQPTLSPPSALGSRFLSSHDPHSKSPSSPLWLPMAVFSKRLRVAIASHPSAHNLPLARVYTGEMSKCLYGLPDPHSPSQTTVLPLSPPFFLAHFLEFTSCSSSSPFHSLSLCLEWISTPACSLNPQYLRVTIQMLFLSEALLDHT